jgi:DNA replication protein
MGFNGFNTPTEKNTPVPAAFFLEILPQITDANELKLILWAFKLLNNQLGDLRYLKTEDFNDAEGFLEGLGKTKKEQAERLDVLLDSVIRRGVFLSARAGKERLYFVNTPRGRAALEALEKGAWQPEDAPRENVTVERPNIFALYEQNVGTLTPILADELRDAEQQYPEEWIKDAFKIALTNNARSWNYIEAILRSWKEKGRDERDQGTPKEGRKLDSEGKFSDYVRH